MSEKAVIIVLRLVGFLFFIWGIWALSSSMIQSCDQIDAIYFNLFFRTKFVPPLLAIAFGILIYLFSRRFARLILHGVR